MSKFIISFVALISVSAAVPVANAQVAPTGTWATETSGPTTYSMYYGGRCTDGTYLYYWGGNGGTLGHQRYDPTANSWSNRTAPLSSIAYTAGEHYGGINYSFGNNYTTGAFYKYTVATNSWALGSGTMSISYAAAASKSGSYIYICGGYIAGYTNVCLRFNPSTDTFTAMATMPGTAYLPGQATSTVSGNVYVTYGTACWEYVPATNTWTTMATLPVARNYHTSFSSLSGRIYVVGGTAATTRVDEFFPQGNVWTQRASTAYSHYYSPGGGMTPANGKCFVWGGYPNYYFCEEYTPPTFGTAPFAAANVKQVGSLGDTVQGGPNPDLGWTNDGIAFTADCTDPDAGQQVRFEVRVKPIADTWANAVVLSSPLGAQGPHNVAYTIPAGGDYDWQYHVVDAFGNFTPNTGGIPAWTEFNSNAVTPDFRSDQVPPSIPQGIFPDVFDVTVPSLVAGDVNFQWSPATDNGPLAAIRYSIEVAHNDMSFGVITASQSGITTTGTTINLACSRYSYYYRVGATDIGGNFSGHSATKYFRIVGDDGENHSSGDAAKLCGGSAPGSMTLAGLAFGVMILAVAFGVRR